MTPTTDPDEILSATSVYMDFVTVCFAGPRISSDSQISESCTVSILDTIHCNTVELVQCCKNRKILNKNILSIKVTESTIGGRYSNSLGARSFESIGEEATVLKTRTIVYTFRSTSHFLIQVTAIHI